MYTWFALGNSSKACASTIKDSRQAEYKNRINIGVLEPCWFSFFPYFSNDNAGLPQSSQMIPLPDDRVPLLESAVSRVIFLRSVFKTHK